jgi:hypothetical protein
LPKTAPVLAEAAVSRSASANTTAADLPPSSRVSRFIVPAEARMIVWPVWVEPVKLILPTPGCSVRAALTVDPGPRTTWKSPSGKSTWAKIRSSSSTESGVSSAGLTMTAFPQASAGAMFHASMTRGKFHGAITVTTPIGSRTVKSRPPSTGIVSPKLLSMAPA